MMNAAEVEPGMVVKYRGHTYTTGEVHDIRVELYRADQFMFIVEISKLTIVEDFK